MAGNFWQSSHCNEWILASQVLMKERAEDLVSISETEYHKLMIFYANVIQAIGEQLKIRQQVIATATVYFKRFYAKNPLRSCDPLLMAPTCIFLAAKVEESGVISNSRMITTVSNTIKSKFAFAFQSEFPYRIGHVWECEFFLLELMDCCLIVFHPYRPLLQYVMDIGHVETLLPVAWRIVNDTYRTDIILLYPPFQIALASLHIACVIMNLIEPARQWFAEINVDMEKIMEITRIILQLYDMWKNYTEKEEISAILEKVPKACTMSGDFRDDPNRIGMKGQSVKGGKG